MRKLFIYSFFILFLTPLTFTYGAETINSGFIPGQIWYSSEELIEGQTVNIHTAIWNGDKNSLTAKVEFYDKNVILGSREITVNSLELKNVSVPWKITSGDHVISAKVASSSSLISGKKEIINLKQGETEADKQSIPVFARDEKGNIISSNGIVKDQLNKTSSKIGSILPDKVNNNISNIFAKIEKFRQTSSLGLTESKKDAQKEIDLMKSENKDNVENIKQKENIEDGIKKPISYIKLVLLTILVLIFASQIIFYGLLVLIIFFILRFIYRKIRNR
jgi:hypothetical protein